MLIVPGEAKKDFATFLYQKGVQQVHINKCQKWLSF